jgi:hypothetical protein
MEQRKLLQIMMLTEPEPSFAHMTLLGETEFAHEVNGRNIFGSSRFTGERGLDLQKEIS